jgi:Zinc carboxypeptidase
MKKIIFLLITLSLLIPSLSGAVQAPSDFFGFEIGSDGNLARWDRIVEYFSHLDQESDRIEVVELGKSTLGNPLIMAIISSPENLASKDKLMEINRKIANPDGLSESAVQDLVNQGKYTLAMTMSLHATEVGGTQASPQIAWEMVTSNDSFHTKMLEECVFLLFPCFNPDGQLMVVDWESKTRGTEYEGARLPKLYHVYTGHDNNRDGFMISQAEAKLVSDVMYKQWYPHAFIDQHHQGGSGSRFYIPPYFDPIHPNIDPLTWREHLEYGSHMALMLEMEGCQGVETGAPYTAWWMPSFHMATNYHNITGMLTESASADMAFPAWVHNHQLQGGSRGRPEYQATVNFPNPWPGGWWKLSDIVKQQMIATWATLDLGASNRERLLESAVLKAQRQIEAGKAKAPYAYLVPANQHDPSALKELLQAFQRSGVRIERSTEEIRSGSRIYPAGTFVISCAQPLRALIVSLLEKIKFPDNEWTHLRDGRPLRPYDMTVFNLAQFMGVHVVKWNQPLDIKTDSIVAPFSVKGTVSGDGENGWITSHKANDSFKALNSLLDSGVEAWWLSDAVAIGSKKEAPGAMLVKTDRVTVEKIAAETGVNFVSAPDLSGAAAFKISSPRLGVYRRYQGGNGDEGWTRWTLEQFRIPYKSVYSSEVLEGNLGQNYDVIVIPDDSLDALKGPDYDNPKPGTAIVPPEFRSGLGDEGIKELKRFAEEGGTIITLDSASALAIDEFKLPITDITRDVDTADYFCPGSTLWVDFDYTHPVAYGMPWRGIGVNWNSPVFKINSRGNRLNSEYSLVGTYPEKDILINGWLDGEKMIAGQTAVVEAPLGKGTVVLMGLRPQLRFWTHGTFKLLFNSIYMASAEEVTL